MQSSMQGSTVHSDKPDIPDNLGMDKESTDQ